MADFGIRRETKNAWERRTPLAPQHVEELVRERGVSLVVQPSDKRIYDDDAYRRAGAVIAEDLSTCKVILGVKEVPPEQILPGKAYLFFAHVIKGQPENMPLLRSLLERRCTLIDYERIVDPFGRRLIFFGRHAGYAGMIDALWSLGRRMQSEGVDSAFAAVRQALTYRSVEEAIVVLAEQVGGRIREQGVHPALHPLVVGFTGGGNVSRGAQEVFDHLPVVEVEPRELAGLAERPQLSRRALYKVVFRREERQDFARHLPALTLLVNGIYWERSHPRLVTRADLRSLWRGERPPKLRVIADLSCDIEGSIEATVLATTPDNPVYVFDPETGQAKSGVEGRGPVILAVANLPAEFPRDASDHFGDALFPFLPDLRAADFGVGLEQLSLPAALRAAVITHGGDLVPRYRYLEEYLGREAS